MKAKLPATGDTSFVFETFPSSLCYTYTTHGNHHKESAHGVERKECFSVFSNQKKRKKKEATDLVGWLVERDVAQDSQRESIQGRPNQTSPPIAANRGYSTWCLACNRNKRPSAHKTTEIISQFCYHSRSGSFDSGMQLRNSARTTPVRHRNSFSIMSFFPIHFKTKTYLVCTAHFR